MSPRFPEDEKRFFWLGPLLDAYDTIDAAVRRVVDRDIRERGVKLACGSGCSTCCHQVIPLTAVELAGIIWFVRFKMAAKARLQLMESIVAAKGTMDCPFLVRDKCGIYAVRPMPCRHFNIYGKRCGVGEDVLEVRPHDVMQPDKEQARRAYRMLLPYYGIHTEKEIKRALNENYLFKHTTPIQDVDWDAMLEW